MTDRALMTVFVLQHSYELGDCDETKMIGIYSSAAAVQSAVERLRTQLGFKDHPEGFVSEAYELDVDHWTEGFITGRD